MQKQNLMNDRASIALTKGTIEKLKKASKAGGLKMYEFVDTMVDVVIGDEELLDKVVNETRLRVAKSREGKAELVSKIESLPIDLQEKLRNIDPNELEALLKRSGRRQAQV
ncbi:hypothetical protein [Methylomicrobium agile]|uniref:hypothetical protein n=1 Tax=Methylomicrobium agile TaxID=39774 RepID=UPI0012F6BD04|nr:hypothetical protein [Methylomicrobium agile]